MGELYNDQHVCAEISDLDNPGIDLAHHHPLTELRLYDVQLEPGEILFVPFGWWHQVKSLDFSVTMAAHQFPLAQQLLRRLPCGVAGRSRRATSRLACISGLKSCIPKSRPLCSHIRVRYSPSLASQREKEIRNCRVVRRVIAAREVFRIVWSAKRNVVVKRTCARKLQGDAVTTPVPDRRAGRFRMQIAEPF